MIHSLETIPLLNCSQDIISASCRRFVSWAMKAFWRQETTLTSTVHQYTREILTKKRKKHKKLEIVLALSVFTYETSPAGHNKEGGFYRIFALSFSSFISSCLPKKLSKITKQIIWLSYNKRCYTNRVKK